MRARTVLQKGQHVGVAPAPGRPRTQISMPRGGRPTQAPGGTCIAWAHLGRRLSAWKVIDEHASVMPYAENNEAAGKRCWQAACRAGLKAPAPTRILFTQVNASEMVAGQPSTTSASIAGTAMKAVTCRFRANFRARVASRAVQEGVRAAAVVHLMPQQCAYEGCLAVLRNEDVRGTNQKQCERR